jgi:hypothetical protein
VGFHRRRTPEPGKHFLHCGPGSHFPLALSTDPVGQDKQPAVRAHLFRRGWAHVTEIVLIPRANRAYIGKLGEFNVEHRTA